MLESLQLYSFLTIFNPPSHTHQEPSRNILNKPKVNRSSHYNERYHIEFICKQGEHKVKEEMSNFKANVQAYHDGMTRLSTALKDSGSMLMLI